MHPSHVHLNDPSPFPPSHVQRKSSSFASFVDGAVAAGRRVAYSKEGDGDNDAPVLGARKLVDGVADVAVLRGAAGATNTSGSFGRHVVCVVLCLWFC